MRPNNVIDAVVEGDLDGETVKMEIDATATAHIMSVLTDLYSDRLMAVIREYATNAWDAHLEAGVTRPIEVTLPSRMSSYYHIKDYGIGLDVEGIRNIYSKYGKSTKRASNDFNGMLGLGCKSAMTYAAQFSIISVKDGMKYNVSVSRGTDGVGEMQVIDSVPTNEPNGVEIVVPIKSADVYAVSQKVAQFFQWWPEGTVLVNGTKPSRFTGREIVKDLYMVDGLEKDLIVMGNVAYPVPYEDGIFAGERDHYGRSRKTFGVVYFAPMGAVTFSPSRESLQTNRNTRETVDKAKALFAANLLISLQKEIDDCDSPVDAMRKYREMRTRYVDIDVASLTYKGEKFVSKWEAPHTITKVKSVYGQMTDRKDYDYFFWYDADGGSSETKLEALDAERVERYHNTMTIIVNGPKSLTPHQRTKIRRVYDERTHIKNCWVFITSESKAPGGMWTKGIKVIDWSIVSNFKITSNTTSDSTKHHVYQPDGSVVHRTVPDAEQIVYVSPTFFSNDNYWGPKEGVYRKFFNDRGYSFMTLGANRHAKFKREHPNSLSLAEGVTKFTDEYNSSLTPEALMYLGMDSEIIHRLTALQGLDLKDKTMVEWTKKVDVAQYRAYKQKHDYFQTITRHGLGTVKDITNIEPFADYPLVECLSTEEVKAHREHVRDYINAVYGSKGKGN